MKLKSFGIRAYRSCKNTKFLLNKNLTALIGINGSGKSNILNAILLLKKILRSRYYPKETTFLNSCFITVEMDCDGSVLCIKGKIIFGTDDRNNDEIISSNLKIKFSESSDWINMPPLEIFSHEYGRKDMHYFYGRTHSNLTEKQYNILLSVFKFFDEINYYSASQFSDPSRCPVSIEIEDDRPRLKSRFSMAGHEQFIYDLYVSFRENNIEYKRYLSAVNKEGIGLIDSISFNDLPMPSSSYEVKSGGKIKTIKRERLLVIPIFVIDGNTLSPNQLSEGTFKTLALLYYILKDNSNFLLIEEPEVCIHHGLLSSIISLIDTQSKKKQIIISTHSDFVLDQLDPENVIIVKRDAKKGTIAKHLNKVLTKNNYKGLKKYLEESGNLGEYWQESGFDYD